MKAIIKKASDYNFMEEMTINTLAGLKAIQDEYDEELIITFSDDGTEVNVVIYDDYVE